MTLRNQKDPIVTIRKEEGKPQGVDRVEDDEVMRDLDNGVTGHISHDRTCTWIEVTQLYESMWTK